MSLRVLAVEDDKTAQVLYGALSRRFDFQVTVVDTCDDALASLKGLSFDVILMDWELCGVNGLECTALIRAQQEIDGQYTPIIAVTAHALAHHREECLRARMDDYLSKPFNGAELYGLIVKWTNPDILRLKKDAE